MRSLPAGGWKVIRRIGSKRSLVVGRRWLGSFAVRYSTDRGALQSSSSLLVISGHLYRPQHGPCLVFRLFKLTLRIGIGHASRARLPIVLLAFNERRENPKPRTKTPGKTGKEAGPAINAAPGWLQFFDDLH